MVVSGHPEVRHTAVAPYSPALPLASRGQQAGLAVGADPGWPFLKGGAFMIAWILGFCAGPILLAGFAAYLCRGPRRLWRLTREQVAEVQVLADLERRENLL